MQNCSHKCAVFRQIEACREACLSCGVCNETNSMQIGSHGVISSDTCGTAGADAFKNRVHIEPATDGVTALPYEVEEKLRMAFADLFHLSPVDWLLIRHLIDGGSFAAFKDFAADVNRELATIASGTPKTVRVCAFTRFKKIIAKCKYASAFALHRFGEGHAGAFVKKALKKEPIQGELFS